MDFVLRPGRARTKQAHVHRARDADLRKPVTWNLAARKGKAQSDLRSYVFPQATRGGSSGRLRGRGGGSASRKSPLIRRQQEAEREVGVPAYGDFKLNTHTQSIVFFLPGPSSSCKNNRSSSNSSSRRNNRRRRRRGERSSPDYCMATLNHTQYAFSGPSSCSNSISGPS